MSHGERQPNGTNLPVGQALTHAATLTGAVARAQQVVGTARTPVVALAVRAPDHRLSIG